MRANDVSALAGKHKFFYLSFTLRIFFTCQSFYIICSSFMEIVVFHAFTSIFHLKFLSGIIFLLSTNRVFACCLATVSKDALHI